MQRNISRAIAICAIVGAAMFAYYIVVPLLQILQAVSR